MTYAEIMKTNIQSMTYEQLKIFYEKVKDFTYYNYDLLDRYTDRQYTEWRKLSNLCSRIYDKLHPLKKLTFASVECKDSKEGGKDWYFDVALDGQWKDKDLVEYLITKVKEKYNKAIARHSSLAGIELIPKEGGDPYSDECEYENFGYCYRLNEIVLLEKENVIIAKHIRTIRLEKPEEEA